MFFVHIISMHIIMHVDLDAFFAACEERERPELKGRPVVVGADPKEGKGRGVVSTANYAARDYGIHSGMPVSKAYRLCRSAVFLPVNFALYHRVSEGVMRILRKHADRFQQVSIDEAFLDVSSCDSYEKAEEAAGMIKKEIEAQEGITCSIGIAANKLVAKTASDLRKPGGLTVVEPEKTAEFLLPLPVRKLYGVGRKTEAALRSIGVETIGDLAKIDVQTLQSMFGRWGTEMHFLANGVDDSEVVEEEGIQSVGREYTFEEDTGDVQLLHEVVDAASEDVAEALAKESVSCRTVVIKVRYENFETHTRQKTLAKNFADAETIRSTAKDLLKSFTESKKRIRLVGVRVTNLHTESRQKSVDEFVKRGTPAAVG